MKVTVAVLALFATASAAPKSPHIIGGQEARPHSIPYQAALEVYGLQTLWLCGGTLISQSYVVTAAHCLDYGEEVEVTLGAHKLKDDEDTQVKLVSSDFKMHEDYDIVTLNNDIGVVKLPKPVDLTDAIQTITLPNNNINDYAGVVATASGWGITDNDEETPSDVLNAVQVSVITNQACEQFYGSIVTSNMLCTSANSGVGICNGDSGGPLVVDRLLIGVSCFSSVFCAQTPSGFTRITSYLEWLKANTDV